MAAARDDQAVPVRLVATDLDGTLLRSDETVSARTLAAIAGLAQAGIPFVVCTARPSRWMGPIAAQLGVDGPAVCANGGVVWDMAAGAVLTQSPIPVAVALEVVARLRPLLPDAAWAIERATVFGHEPSYRPRWPIPDDSVVDHVEMLLGEPCVKLMLRTATGSADELLALAREAVGTLVEVTHSSTADTLLEMSAAGVSKGSALVEVCHAQGIGPESVVAFGDMPNDLPMLRWAGRGVAVANAHPEVRAVADELAASNDEDGVAQVLERLLV